MSASVPPPAPTDESTHTLRLDVGEMSCASCAGRVERALRALPGVGRAEVNLATGRAEVRYDPRAVSSADVVEAIRAAGYAPVTAETELVVRGMSCASCAGRVERALASLPGVIEARVNPATAWARVVHLPPMGGAERFAAAVREAGYDASPAQAETASRDTEGEEGGRGRDGSLGRDALVAGVLGFVVLLLAMGPSVVSGLGRLLDVVSPFRGFRAGLEGLLSAIVLLGPGRRFFRPGWQAWRHLAPDMNALVATGTAAAWVYSALVLIVPGLVPPAARHVYFDSAAVVVAAVLAGRWLEERGKRRATGALRKLAALQVRTAHRLAADGREKDVAVDAVRVGDRLVVRPGERLPVDGTIVEGTAHIDESMLTGEPFPVVRSEGGRVVGGTVDRDGRLVVEATAVGDETVLAQIVRLVEGAQAGKLPVERIADRVVRVFAPAVLVAALLSFVGWMLSGAPVNVALVAAVAVLVVACPCALGLATPVAIAVGTGRAAELGVLFRKGEALETLARADTVLFDKTGTLTRGRPVLVGRDGPDPDEALGLAAALEASSNHPLGRAVVEAARGSGTAIPAATDVRAEPGLGLRGRVEGRTVLVGSRRFLLGCGVDGVTEDAPGSDTPARGTAVHVAADGVYRGRLLVADPLRPEARAVVDALRDRGLRLAMVSGDSREPARAVARTLGLDEVHAEVLPGEKARVVRALQESGRRVAFVGDGINDAPALARADVGLALADGTDIAIESASVILARGELAGVVTAIDTARRTLRAVRLNLFWAFVYNVLLIPVAAGALVPWGLRLNPMLAGVAMAFSSLFVVAQSLRLRRLRPFVPDADVRGPGAGTAAPCAVARTGPITPPVVGTCGEAPRA